MDKLKVLGTIVALVYILFVVYLFNGDSTLAFSISSLICPLMALLYFVTVKRKTIAFSSFLVLYSISEVMTLFIDYIPNQIDYYIGNSLYILAYTCLMIEVCKTVCVLQVLKNYKLHLLVLIGLNVYIVYILHSKVQPYKMFTLEFFIELLYNVVILVLLSIALLNYFYRDNRKSLHFFLGALCIVFAEVIQVAYLYISNKTIFLHFISVTLYFAAFIFLYRQSRLGNDITINRFINEEI